MNIVLITFPGKGVAKARRQLKAGRAVRWLYLGASYATLRGVEEMLGNEFKRIDIGRLQEAIASGLRTEYVQWVDGLNRKSGDDLEWWYGPVSSRNVYHSDLFQNVS